MYLHVFDFKFQVSTFFPRSSLDNKIADTCALWLPFNSTPLSLYLGQWLHANFFPSIKKEILPILPVNTSTGLASQDLLIILPAKKSALLLAPRLPGLAHSISLLSCLRSAQSCCLPATLPTSASPPTYLFLLRLFFFCASHHCTKLSSTCSQKEHNSPGCLSFSSTWSTGLLECCCSYAVDYPVDTPGVHITSLSLETWLLVTH